MQERRLNKVARLIQKELAELFRKETQSFSKGTIISVTRIRITPDLALCKVFLSVFPSEKADELIENIKQNKKQIRGDMGKKMAHQLRIIPDLEFFKDDSLDYLERIDELLKK